MRDEAELWAECGAGSVAARDALVGIYLPFVKRVALGLKRRLPASVEVDDLVSDGSIALLDAIKRFEPSRAVAFTTYAYRHVWGAMITGLRDMDWVPRKVRDAGVVVPPILSIDDDRVCQVDSAGGLLHFHELHEDRRARLGVAAIEERDEWEHKLRSLPSPRSRRIAERFFRRGDAMKSIGADEHLSESSVSYLTGQICEALYPGQRPKRFRSTHLKPPVPALKKPVVSDRGERYDSAADAARALGKHPNAVRCAMQQGTRAGGRYWSLVLEEVAA